MADYNELITSGIAVDCDSLNDAIGVNKDLMLVNFTYLDREATLSSRETDNTNNNLGGLSKLVLKEGAKLYVYQGKDYSVIPNITSETKENGVTKYKHSIDFTIYSKKAYDKKILETLGKSRVLAIAKDKSTGLYEIFGIDRGLEVGNISRAYNGSQNSNFYTVSISTPDRAKLIESSLSETTIKLEIIGEVNLQGDLQYAL